MNDKLKLHWFLVTALNDSNLTEEQIHEAISNDNVNVTVGALDNMPAVILDWRGLAALCEEHIPDDKIKDMNRLDFETMGAMVKNEMESEILAVYSRISEVLKDKVVPAYMKFKEMKEKGGDINNDNS